MTFMINGSIPIHDAYPTVQEPPVFLEPGPTKVRATVIPTRVLPKYEMRVGRPWINQNGINWWMQFFSSPSQLYVQVTIDFFHPELNAWVSGSAYMWRPTFGSETMAACKFSDFSVQFTGIEWSYSLE